MPRTTVSVPQEDLLRLKEIARANKVKVSQVVRWAIDQYLGSAPPAIQPSLPLQRGK